MTLLLRPPVVLLFVASGCAALIYEVVWFQLLQIVIGSSAISVGVLLGTFMGGMCAGSVLAPRAIGARWRPLRVYAALELAIAVSGLLLLAVVPRLDGLYALGGGSIALRVLLASVCLLPPAIAMGATLPVVARAVEPSRAGLAWLGWLYAGNLAGAVIGALLAGFYLLRVYDVVVATAAAAALNVTAAAAAWVMGRHVAAMRDASAPGVDRSGGTIYIVIALSGMTALAAQVVWTRVLSLAFGATVYTFSLILAAVLVGLGLGSSLGAAFGRSVRVQPRVALGWAQLSLVVAVMWAAYSLAIVIPFWTLDAAAARDPWRVFRHDLVRALVVVLPGALVWGASFPLALASLASRAQDAGRLAGGVYAANTAGAVAGALGTGLVLLPHVGSHIVQQALIVVAGAAGFLALATGRRGAAAEFERVARLERRTMPSEAPRSRTIERLQRPTTPSSGSKSRTHELSNARTGELLKSRAVRLLEGGGIAVSVAVAVWGVLPVPAPLIAHGRQAAEWADAARVADAGSILFTGEGRHDFIAVSRGPAGQRYYHASGKVQASTVPEDLRLQLLLGHLSHLTPARPARALVIGCGAGITAGAFALAPGVERITIAEIEPLVPVVAAAYFGDDNHQIIQDPRVALRIDDGRHLLATSGETYDVITTDLIDPWVKGVAALFTREFFELAKRRLRPGGVVTQFVQLYQSSPDAVKTEIATFLDVFPHAVVWGNPHDGQGYDLVLLGQVDPVRIDVDALEARLGQDDYARVRASLHTIGIAGAVDLLATYAGSGAQLAPWLRGAAINRDRDLRLQYLAGLGLNLDENAAIYREMIAHARFPDEMFTGSPETLARLRAALTERGLGGSGS
jgi:spermidine synthase